MTTTKRHLTLAINRPAQRVDGPKPPPRAATYLVNVLLPRLRDERHYTCRRSVVRARGDAEAARLVHESGHMTELSEHIVFDVGDGPVDVLSEMELTPKQTDSLRRRVQVIYTWPLSRLPRG